MDEQRLMAGLAGHRFLGGVASPPNAVAIF